MTLNVDLEEVPFAILEAVKARILANRRRLQQGQQQGPKPSLRPRPQRPRIGASSKSWRMPKEAAALLEDDVLIVSWKDGDPVLSDAQAELIYLEGIGNGTATTMTVGSEVPAVGVSGSPQVWQAWSYKTEISVSGRSDFTYEAWVQNGQPGGLSSSLFTIGLQFGDGQVGTSQYVDLRAGVTSGSGNPLFPNGSGYLYVDPVLGTFQEQYSPPNAYAPQHLCIMRKSGVFYYFLNGASVAVSDSTEALAVSFSGDMKVQFALYANPYPTLNKLGQLRFTPELAFYNPDGFIPDQLPFS